MFCTNKCPKIQHNVKYFVDNQNLTHPKMDEFLSKCSKAQNYSKKTLKNPNRGNP